MVYLQMASFLENGGLMSQSASPWEDGRLMSQSPYLPLSTGRSFFKEGEGNRTKRSREEVEKLSTCRGAHSILIRQVMVQCAPSWSSHPGLVILNSCHPDFMSSWLHAWRSANLPELGCLKIRFYILWS